MQLFLEFQFPIRGSKNIINFKTRNITKCFSFPLGVVRPIKSSCFCISGKFQFPIRGSKVIIVIAIIITRTFQFPIRGSKVLIIIDLCLLELVSVSH